jgi:hypothetical protein
VEDALTEVLRMDPHATLRAVRHIRRLRGGAQSHLMLAQDGGYYVVKFQNNPQDVRVLANELLGARLAEALELPAAHAEVIEVSKELIVETPELTVEYGHKTVPCTPGRQVATRYILQPAGLFDYLPEAVFDRIRNRESFAGMLAFDKWTCNTDYRQAIFARLPRQRKYSAVFIDQGHCFNEGEWNFPDAPLRGLYPQRGVYRFVTGWESFEPWLSRLESLDGAELYNRVADMPREWYGQWTDLERLVETLLRRRRSVRTLLHDSRKTLPELFPEWREP